MADAAGTFGDQTFAKRTVRDAEGNRPARAAGFQFAGRRGFEIDAKLMQPAWPGQAGFQRDIQDAFAVAEQLFRVREREALEKILRRDAGAWQLEKESLQRKGFTVWHWRNEMIWFTLAPVLFCGVLTLFFSLWSGRLMWEVPLFFFTQSIIAFTLLELVNYIEHYGIVRKQDANGK